MTRVANTQIGGNHAAALYRRLRWWRGLACGPLGLAVLTWALPAGTAQEQGLAQRVAALKTLLKPFTRVGNEVLITGANLHIVNGRGHTDCLHEEFNPIPDCPNGLGNPIVGYNEPRAPDVETIRMGSHNVVVGLGHNFSRFGGIVVGQLNTISGDFASVSGGNSTRPGASPPLSVAGSRTRLAAAAPLSEFLHDLKMAAGQALRTTQVGEGMDPRDRSNPWAVYDHYIDRVVVQCVNTLTPKWSTKLAAFDEFIWDQCYAMEQSLRID